MCGIVGLISNKSAAAAEVLEALFNLEYRGYDSAGMASVSEGRVFFKKDVGKLASVQEKHQLDQLPGNLAMGHVRWATHGAVTEANAHPHLDCKKQIAVVHNGIIDNYQELRAQLEPKHKFTSQTDTEVIPHLIEDHMEQGLGLEEAVRKTVGQLKGSYALLAISALEPDKIVGARNDSPMVVGLDKDKVFIASDALSFLKHTNKVIFLDDGDMVTATSQGIKFTDSQGQLVSKKPTQVDWTWEHATKQGYDFFMLKEIMEEPKAIETALKQDRQQLLEIAIDILRARQVVIPACGTSRYAALIGRYLFSKLAGKFCDVVMASEFQYFSESIDRNSLVIAVSQSGETADVMEGVKQARANGAQIFSVVNVVGSSLARMSDRVIYLNCGPEISVAATKSFVSQLVIFYLMAFAMSNQLDEGISKLKGIARLIDDNTKHNFSNISQLAEYTKDRNDFYYIARGINFAIAAEGSLKLKELSYIHAEGMPAGELKHGTLALIEPGTPVVAICPKDYTFYETLSNVAEAKARGAFIIGVSDEYNEIYDQWIKIPTVEEIFYPLVSVVPLQLLAYHLAISRGHDPDKPRNLAKSVTVK